MHRDFSRRRTTHHTLSSAEVRNNVALTISKINENKIWGGGGGGHGPPWSLGRTATADRQATGRLEIHVKKISIWHS